MESFTFFKFQYPCLTKPITTYLLIVIQELHGTQSFIKHWLFHMNDFANEHNIC